jgi:hypothetical protein
LARCTTSQVLPGDLFLSSGAAVNEKIAIRRLEPTESYRTLGVHISPLGSITGALTVLLDQVTSYNASITTSQLTRAEAIASFIQHLLPKLRFQLPVLSLTKHDCDKLLSIALHAFLPKIHINRNTSRAIVHGPFSIGGLAIPHIHTVQGIDKLHLFLGHLRLHDDTGKFIHIDLTYIQLLLGMPTLFLNLDPNQFLWIDKVWLTSLWDFIYAADLQIHYPEQWLPTLSRENDIFLME